MKYINQILHAVQFAERYHRGQTRNNSGAPYIVHPLAVASSITMIADEDSYDANTIIAAILHDVIEDTDASLQDIMVEFGIDVAALVLQVTKVTQGSDLPRAQRVQLDVNHYAKAEARAQTIKVADILNNISDIHEVDPKFAKRYLPEQKAKLDVLTKADHQLRTTTIQLLQHQMTIVFDK